MNNKLHNELLVAKFLTKGGGIFTKPTGKKLLGLKEIPGKDIKKSKFWCQQREKTRAALVDLEVFLETAGEENISQVFTNESLEPIIVALLFNSMTLDKTIDPGNKRNNADIARMLIKWAFESLSEMAPDLMTLPHQQAKEAAIDLANFLAESFKPKNEQRYSRPGSASY
jgi:hypothetical protein